MSDNKRDKGGLIPEEHQRPRRPNTDTITYLRSLPLDVTVATEEITNFLSGKTPVVVTEGDDADAAAGATSEPPEYPSTLIAALSALDEIRNEIASLAGEEHAAECIEVLAHITAPYSETAARKLLYSCSGYALHLATHRYGSHVLQTLLQLAVTAKSDLDLALHNDAPQLEETQEDLPSLTDLLLSLQEELRPHASELAIHICGSHVLRTLCCVMGGVELQTERPGQAIRRGKNKPKSKKKKKAPVESTTPHTRMNYLSSSRIPSNNSKIQKSLRKLTEAVSGSKVLPPGDLQKLACHPSGGPLLMLLLRVLTYAGADEEQRAHFQKMEQQSKAVDHHLGVIGQEPTFVLGSAAHALAERLICYKSGNVEQPWATDVIYGLAGEPRASHVLETLMRLSPDEFYGSILEHGGFTTSATLDEYVQHDVSNFVVQTLLATLRNTDQVERMLSALEPLVSSGFVVESANRRRGILWRLVEMVSKFKVGQDLVLESIRKGFATLQGEKIPATSLAAVISSLLGLQIPEKDGERLQLDVEGTRTVYHLLRLEPQHCKVVLKGVLALSQQDFELLAKDGLGSRCILDGILEDPSKDSVFTKATKQLLVKLQGRWVALSADRIGHHTTKKTFQALEDMASREELVQELAEGTNRLSGNAMGRSVMDTCAVREYMSKGQDQWRKTVQKTLESAEWLKEMVSRDNHRRDDVKTDSSQERKREGSDPERASKKSRKAGVTMDSIMEAISIPAKAKR
jgi:nucleolar protein 9